LDNTNAERQRRWIAKLKAKAAAAESVTNAKLKAELDRLKAENAWLKTELQRKHSKPKAAKPPLPPDEARERTVKRLRTQIQNLKASLAAVVGRANMPRATQNAVVKVLHPDERKHWTREKLNEALDEACRAFTAWKGDRDKAIGMGNLAKNMS
jgi:hypothetical protein